MALRVSGPAPELVSDEGSISVTGEGFQETWQRCLFRIVEAWT
jgi:hypothetical protein